MFRAMLVFVVAACAGTARTKAPTTACADVAVIPAGEDSPRDYRRLQLVKSSETVATDEQRLASLRQAACAVGADAVIETVNEEVRCSGSGCAGYVLIASGIAVVWTNPAPAAGK
jgi:hypothetical protein